MRTPTQRQPGPRQIVTTLRGYIDRRDGRSPLDITLIYDPADPAVLQMRPTPYIKWVFDRHWLYTAVAGTVPDWYDALPDEARDLVDFVAIRDVCDPDRIVIDLRSPDGGVRLGLPVRPVQEWLRRVWAAMSDAEEAMAVSVAADRLTPEWFRQSRSAWE